MIVGVRRGAEPSVCSPHRVSTPAVTAHRQRAKLTTVKTLGRIPLLLVAISGGVLVAFTPATAVVLIVAAIAGGWVLRDARRMGTPRHLALGFLGASAGVAVIRGLRVLPIGGGDDSRAYYAKGARLAASGQWDSLSDLWGAVSGTQFVDNLVGRWIGLAGGSYAATFALFTVLGVLGHWNFASVALLGGGRARHRIWLFLLFTPSLVFWSSGIGKDVLVFFGVGLAVRLWARSDGSRLRRLACIGFALALTFFARPPIAILVLAAAGLGWLWSVVSRERTSLSVVKGIAVVTLLLAVAALAVDVVASYAAKDATASTVGDVLGSLENGRAVGGSGFTPTPIKSPSSLVPGLVAVAVNPIRRAPGPLTVIATLELIIAIAIAARRERRGLSGFGAARVTFLAAAFLMTVALSSSYNVGLLLRQQCLLVVFLALSGSTEPTPRLAPARPHTRAHQRRSAPAQAVVCA